MIPELLACFAMPARTPLRSNDGAPRRASRHRSRTAWRFLPWVAALALLASGCGGHDWLGLWHEDFEETCGDTPCGWTQVAGPMGAVTYVETGPSEHGLQLTGIGAAVSRALDGDELVGSDPIRSLQAHVVARCDRGAQLTLILTVQNLAGGSPIDVSGSATYPSEWDGTRTTFDLFANDAANSAASFNGLLGIVLHKEGPGTCEVDYVSLASQRFGFPE